MKATRAKAADLMPNSAPTNAEPSRATQQKVVKPPRSPYRGYTSRTERNLVETAAIAGSFKTLGTAIRTAGLVDTLSGKGPFTLFAPTDEAFGKLPKADLDGLLKDKTRLTKVLNYHVVSSIVKAPKEASPKSAITVNGAELEITAKGRGFKVNDATVVDNEIVASNGVIHAIDTVLMPR